MKTLLIFNLILLTTAFTYGQETIKRNNSIGITAITEHYNVLKNDKKTRQGQYTATYKTDGKDVLLAKGTYLNGIRVGTWDFFTTKKLIQTYDYSLQKLTFCKRTDAYNLKLKYYVEDAKPTDSVSAPVKLGGSMYGMLPLVFRDELSKKIHDDNPGIKNAEYLHTINIDEQGNILSHTVSININGNIKNYPLDDSHIDADIARFVPAMINNKPVASRITMITNSTFSSNNY